jgi:four helix bundle protein
MKTRHEDLAAWRHSIALAAKVYAATRQLPSDEPLGLVGELRRAALSVPTSIAACAACGRHCEFVHCLQAARSALAQLHTQLVLGPAQELIAAAASPRSDVRKVSGDVASLIRRVGTSALVTTAGRSCACQDSGRTGF